MPERSTYLDQLAILNEQNFLGGAANLGKALKEKKQNETLVDLYNKFKADKNELKTTIEQQGDFNKHLSTVNMEDGEKAPPEVTMYANFMKTVDEMGAYTNLYQPFITAFATLGDDGMKVANSLSNELATQLQLSEAKGNVPLRDLEYKTLAQDFYWTRDKHQSWLKDEALKRDTMEAADYILNSPTFDLMEGGDITTASSERLKKHNVAIKTIVDDAFEHFEGKMSKGAITTALQMAMGFSGKSFKFNDLASLSRQTGLGINDMELSGYMSLLRGWTADWINMNPQLRQAVKNYMQDGTLPDVELAKVGQVPDPDLVKQMAKTYNPTGDYMNFYSLVASTVPGFMDISKKQFGDETLDLPSLAGTEDIMRPFGPYGIVKGDYIYNPYSVTKLQQKLRKEVDDATEGNIYDMGFNPRGLGTMEETIEQRETWIRLYEQEQSTKGKLPANSPLLNFGK